MRYFALSQGQRYDLAGDLTEAQARIVAETKLNLNQYQLKTHDEYWSSGQGKAERKSLDEDSLKQRIRLFARDRVRAIDPALDNDLLEVLWPMLNQAQAGPDVLRARAIRAYARNVMRSLPEGYVPEADTAWP